ncbi:MAG: P-II family nitrogen regulator [Candidatus Eisenbacteria bacterium]
MRRIEAYIQPFMLARVVRELHGIHVHGLTVLEVKGFGREKDESYPHHAEDYAVDFTPKTKLELLCRDEEVEALIEAILRGAQTGRRGDGKVYVTQVERAISVRTGESGEAVL